MSLQERLLRRVSKSMPAAVSALAYVRVSSEQQTTSDLSIPSQIAIVREHADREGIAILDWFVEVGSAFEGERPEFERMVRRALDDSAVNGILVHDSSRFCRDPGRALVLRRDLRDRGVSLLSATEPDYDPETVSGLALELMGSFRNAAFSLDVSMHTRRAQALNVQTRDPETGFCWHSGGAALWGFQPVRVQVGTDKRGLPLHKCRWGLDRREVAGAQVWEWCRRALIEWRLGERASVATIAGRLNEAGIPSPRGSRWAFTSIYALMRPWCLLEFAAYAVWGVHGKRGRIRPASEWIIVADGNPHLISEDEADALYTVGEELSEVARRIAPRRMAETASCGSRWLLSGGLFQCSCGMAMSSYHNSGRDYYRCSRHTRRIGGGDCRTVQVRKMEIESLVWEAVEGLLEAATREEGSVTRNTQKAKTEREARLSQLRKQRGNIRAAILAGFKDVKWANAQLERIDTEENALNQLATEDDRVGLADRGRFRALKRDLPRVVSEGRAEEKREFVRRFVRRVDLDAAARRIEVQIGLPGEDGEGEVLHFRIAPNGAIGRAQDDAGEVPE